MHAEGVEFASVNVLEDAEVREGIKAYSEWPTIPQASVTEKQSNAQQTDRQNTLVLPPSH